MLSLLEFSINRIFKKNAFYVVLFLPLLTYKKSWILFTDLCIKLRPCLPRHMCAPASHQSSLWSRTIYASPRCALGASDTGLSLRNLNLQAFHLEAYTTFYWNVACSLLPLLTFALTARFKSNSVKFSKQKCHPIATLRRVCKIWVTCVISATRLCASLMFKTTDWVLISDYCKWFDSN